MSSQGDRPDKGKQAAAVVATVSASPLISSAIAAGTITQSRVNQIVVAAINNLRQGE